MPMQLDLDEDDVARMSVDRSSCAGDNGREGFFIRLPNLRIHFQDEADAVRLARMILDRMGETHPETIPTIDTFDEDTPCICGPECPTACKGGCGCEKCRNDYSDFLSCE